MERILDYHVTVASDGSVYLWQWQGMFQGSEEKSFKDQQGGLVVAHILNENNSSGLTSSFYHCQGGTE